MAMTTKYYVGNIHETNGDKEYTTTVFYKADNGIDAKSSLEATAREWYGEEGDYDAEYDAYWFNGEVLVSSGSCKEISKSTFDELYNYQGDQ